MMKRINITIDEDLLNKIDTYSKKRYLTRSGLISAVLSGYLDHVENCQRNQRPRESFRH